MTSHREIAGSGFTLIEIMVVLVILGLVLSLLVGRGPMRSPAMEAHAVVAELAETLRGARGKAIATNRPVTVAFDITERVVRLDNGPRWILPARMTLTVTTVSDNTFGQRLGAITFAPDGSSSGGSIELRDGQLQLRIGVDWLTGRVSMADGR